jgi:dTDP-4-dehydrorhamnose reductase
MKVFIFGKNGMLGNYIFNYLIKHSYYVVPITREDFDAFVITYNKMDMILKALNIKDGDVIINCIGKIPQREKEFTNNPISEYIKINTLLPIFLSLLAEKHKYKFIHITTDCVYNGLENGKYDELSENDETNMYGVSKSLGELGDLRATIIRTSIIGEEKYNKKSLLAWIKSNKNGKINGYTNHYWNGVTCLELSRIIKDIILKNKYWKGIRHIFSPSPVNKFELCNIINNVFDLNIDIQPVETEVKINKTLNTIYPENNEFNIIKIEEQIQNLKNFKII